MRFDATVLDRTIPIAREAGDWNAKARARSRIVLQVTLLPRIFDTVIHHLGRRVRGLQRGWNSHPKPVARSVMASPAPKVILVGAHPDDETIGAGILLTLLPDVSLVHVTDGAPRNTPMVIKLGLSSLAEYAELRRQETVSALDAAGVHAGSFTTIGIADQEAVNNMGLMTGKLIDLLPGHDLVITHAYEGAHPDHDATALAVHAACRILRQSGRSAPDIVEMTGYHFSGGQAVFGRFIDHRDAGPVETLDLSPSQRDLKRRMFECYRTQTGVLKDFTIGTESFRQAPRYDFLQPPHPGTLFYERHGWKITGRSWRDEAGRALRSLDLLNRL